MWILASAGFAETRRARSRARSSVVPSCPQSLSTDPTSACKRYHPCGSRSARARISSRKRRRIRLRSTAEPIRFGVEKATRTPPAAGSVTKRNDNEDSRTTRLARNGAKPTRLGMRPITPTNERDPCRVATSRRRDHLWSSSACEIRASWHDDAYWVEMYVSRLSPDVTFKAIGSNASRLGEQVRRSQRSSKHPRCDSSF